MPPCPTVILAGGRARRLGGVAKPMCLLAGRPLLDHIRDRLGPQAAPLALAVAEASGPLAATGLPLCLDPMPDRPGPLAGVLAGLEGLAEGDGDWLLTVPGDTPFLPRDLIPRLHAATGAADIVCARSGGRRHPVIALWHRRLAGDLRRALANGIRAVDRWGAEYRRREVAWPTDPIDPFFNINTPEDLVRAERFIQAGH